MKFFRFFLIFLALIHLSQGQGPPGWLSSEVSPAKTAEWLRNSDSSRPAPASASAMSFTPPPAVTQREAAASLSNHTPSPTAPGAQSLRSNNLTTPGGNDADFVTPEIEALARGLRNDPVKIYEYVYNYIKFEPYFGSKKGAHLTLLERGGNEHDQCALLVSLLRAAGLNPNYKYGPCTFVYAQMASWYGISTSPFAHWTDAQLSAYYYPSGGAPAGFPSLAFRQKLTIYEFLNPKGYPYVEAFDNSGTTFYSIPHVWVELGGKKLSPALKYQTVRSGINLVAATSYARSQILGDAGGTVNTDGGARWVSGINYTSLASRLTSYTQNFTQAVKATDDWRHPDRITESTSLNKKSYTTLDDATVIFPDDDAAGNWLPFETWSEIPTGHMSKLEIRAGVWNGTSWTDTYFNQTINLAGLRAQKLSLSYVGNSARIYLDETLVGGSAFTIPAGQTSMDLRLGVTHPHYELRYQGGSFVATNLEKSNQAETKKYQVGTDSSYAIIYSFSNPDLHSRARQEKLDTYLRSGLTDADWRVKTESLNLMGLNWLHQCYLADEAITGLYRVIPVHHHRFGRVGQEPSFAGNQQSFYIDVGLSFAANSHRTMNFAEELNFAYFSSTLSSAMEHGVLEQMQGAGLGATSTVKMVYLANQEEQRLYRATASNWSMVSPELLNYPSSRVTSVGTSLSANSQSRALLPRSGQIVLNQYKGFGYALEEPSRVSMLIGSNFGGYNSQPGSASSAPIVTSNTSNPAYSASSTLLPISNVPQNLQQARFNDPVDVLSGAFVMDSTDLVLGSGAAPGGLQFSRSYNSNSRFNLAPGLGYGWTHDHDITATRRSSIKAGLGATNTYQAAPFFAALTVASDLSRNHATAKEWATAALAIHWAVDQLKYKAVAISQGNRTYEFIEMPDGSYVSPAGSKLTLIKNGAGNFELTQRHGSTWFFRTDGKIDSITDRFGKTQQYTYNAANQLTKVTDAYNREINFTWAGSKISGIADTTGRSVGLSYTGDDLTTVTDVEGKMMTYLYDAAHRITQIKDALNRTTIENDYDSQSRVISQRNQGDPNKFYQIYYTGYANTEVNPLAGGTTHLYDDRGRIIGSKDALGNSDTNIYDGQDRKITYLSPKAEITDWEYNSDHNLTQENDPKSKVTDYFYDPQLRLQRVNDKRVKDTTFTYNAAHQVLTTTDPLLHVITNQYQSNGLLSSTIDAENKTTSFTYDSWGQANKITYPDSSFQTLVNDARGNVLTTTDPENRMVTNTYNNRRQPLTTTAPNLAGESAAITTATYDDAGNPLTTTDAKGNVTSHNYNSLANRVTTTLPALVAGNNVVTSTYDSRDWLTTTANSLGQTATTEYDAAHRPIAVIDPLNRRMENQYDANGQVTQAKDPLNRVTKQVWNVRGEKERGTDALNKNTDFSYDNNGNLTKRTNRRGKFYLFTFDAANRPSTTTTPTGKVTLMTYFNNNQVKAIQEPSAQTSTLSYNAKNLISSKTDPTGTITYGYNNAGDLLTVTEGSATLTRTYDGRGRLKSFTTADGDLIQYQYDANNNLTRLTYPDGKQVNYTYNSRNLLATVTDWSSRVTNYTYDRLGRLTGTTRPNGTSNQIAHDAASQLTSVKEYSGTKLISYLAFRYDAAGQIESRFRAPLINSGWQHPALTATYDDDNRVLTANGQPVTHDADGNMTRSVGILPTSPNTPIDLTYNSRNQLTSAAGTTYTYDAEGRRRTLTDATGTTRDAIDPSGKLLVRTQPSGAKTYYVYGLGLLYEANQANATKTYHFDQVGSTLLRTNDSGIIIGRAEYSAYGIQFWKQGDMATPFLYNGQAGVQTDPNGLLNMRARYYSPYLCRFLNADPIGFSGGSNWFAYADGNPISKSDPFGLCPDRNLCTGGTGRGNAAASENVGQTAMAVELLLGFTPFGVLMDATSVGIGAYNGDMAGVGIGVVGFLPFGDFAKLGKVARYEDEMVDVYRGVHGGHPDLPNAYNGQANPRGGHSDPARHNDFDNESIFTSWTTERNVAADHATQWGTTEGVILQQTVPRSSLTPSPDRLMESEVLRVGPVTGATPTILNR